jgi:hypothetical protein
MEFKIKMKMKIMNSKGYVSKQSQVNLRYYPRIFMEILRKSTRNLSRGSQSQGRYLNPGTFENEVIVLPTQPQCSLTVCTKRYKIHELQM